MDVKPVWRLLKDTYLAWRKDNAPLLAAGLSYFSVFSLVPILVIAIAAAGLVFGPKAASGELVRQAKVFVGGQVARTLETLIRNAQESGMGFATLFSTGLLIVGASGMFGQLQTALNIIWDVDPQRGVRNAIKNRLLPFAMVLCIGVVLILFFAVDAGLAAFRAWGGGLLPFLGYLPLWEAANYLVTILVITLLSAAIFKFLPGTRIAWRDVWVGAAVTALLLSAGMYLIGLYFSMRRFGSVYGVAGSVLAIFIWIYYSAQIFLFGAEFTWVYANRYGSRAGTGAKKPAGDPLRR